MKAVNAHWGVTLLILGQHGFPHLCVWSQQHVLIAWSDDKPFKVPRVNLKLKMPLLCQVQRKVCYSVFVQFHDPVKKKIPSVDLAPWGRQCGPEFCFRESASPKELIKQANIFWWGQEVAHIWHWKVKGVLGGGSWGTMGSGVEVSQVRSLTQKWVALPISFAPLNTLIAEN